ncbi:hypothetical protein [Cytobacillus gottheilii]|uniref:hypothetical protein n=1 Tax=Cytobacillus gottheilii TaxID=859144 RepID=UPI002494BD13|nr:hypothetical protein [Cytobacillus gottheilii]
MAKNIKSLKGRKFFQEALLKLKVEHECYPLPASAITTYILFNLECDDLGRIQANSFSLNKFSKATGIPYSTIHGGMDVLFKRGFMREVIINKQPYYEIIGYSTWNTPEFNKVSGREESLNYFRIPFSLKESSALKRLVSSRDSAGLLMLLDLFNTFTRLINMRNKDLEKGLTRTMHHLKGKMKKTALKIRVWIDIIKEFFTFEAVGLVKKNPRSDRLTIRKTKNPVQIVIEKFNITINPSIIDEMGDDYNTREIEAAIRKEVTFKLAEEGVKHTNKDIRDILAAAKQEIIEVMKFSTSSFSVRNRIIIDVFNAAFDDFLHYYKEKETTDPHNQVKIIGAFMRNCIIDSFTKYIFNPNPHYEAVEEAVMHFANKHQKYPRFFKREK